MRALFTLLIATALGLAQSSAKFPAGVVHPADLGIVSNRAQTTLTAGITSSSTTLSVPSTSGFKAPSFISIENEILAVCAIPDGNHFTIGISACPNVDGRGVDTLNGGGAAVPHLVNSVVQVRIVAQTLNQASAEIVALEQALQPTISVLGYGAKCDGTTDDFSAIQTALNAVPSTGGTVSFPGRTCVYSHTLWAHSNTNLLGVGGRSQVTRLKRANGMYTDGLASGLYDGLQHPGETTYVGFDGGLPYTAASPGQNIAIRGIYFDGNTNNAGQPPGEPTPPNAQYRGSNVSLRYIDGVTIEDVWSDNVPNDALFIYACRRVQIVNSEVSNSHLLNGYGNQTRNGLTFAGTFSGSSQDNDVDANLLTNVVAHDNDNLGVALQARTSLVSGTQGTDVVVSNLVTYNNQDYGLAVEYSSADPSIAPMKNVIVNGWASTNDGYGPNGHHMGFAGSFDSVENTVLSNLVIKDAPVNALIIARGQQLTLDNVKIQGWNNTAIAGDTSAILVYSDVVGGIKQASLRGIHISGDGRARPGSTGLSVSTTIDTLHLHDIHVEGGKFDAANSATGIGIQVSANHIIASNLSASGADNVGIHIVNSVDTLSLNGCAVWNNGQAAGATWRAGLVIDWPVNRGHIANCAGFDNQPVPTQVWGFSFTNAATRRISTSGLNGYGNTSGVMNVALTSGIPAVITRDADLDAQVIVQAGPSQTKPLLDLTTPDQNTHYVRVDSAGKTMWNTITPGSYGDGNGDVVLHEKQVVFERGLATSIAWESAVGNFVSSVLYANGWFDLSQIRVKGAQTVSSGKGIEMSYNAGIGYIHAYDRDAGAPKVLALSHTGGRTLIGGTADDGSTDVQLNGLVSVDFGTNVVYRCTAAGALPVGSLTITAGNCGSTVDSGLRLH